MAIAYFCAMEQHERFMRRCLELAGHGLGTTYPNPMVGSVLVHEGKIIGEGWHRRAGESHAEVMAIGSVRDRSLLRNATLYVSLEPCNHHGKTPPCTSLILASGIPKVVVGAVDSHELVSGSGIAALREAGVDVVAGVLEDDCRALNRRFFTYHEKQRPYVILKWAESADGFLAPEHREAGKPFFLSTPLSRQLVHRWRTEEAAILVGTQTALDDNPRLTAREWTGKQPLRVLIDRDRRVPTTAHLFDDEAPTLVFSEVGGSGPAVVVPFENLPVEILTKLHKRQIQSVIIEGGRATLQSFIDAGLWDEARVFRCEVSCGSGVAAPRLGGRLVRREKIADDELLIFAHD